MSTKMDTPRTQHFTTRAMRAVRNLVKGLSTAEIRGHLDQADAACIAGWAADGSPGKRLELEVLVDGVPLMLTVADKYREDLLAAGIGDGKHGFRFRLPDSYYDGQEHAVAIRVVSSGEFLPGSPETFLATPEEAGKTVGFVESCDSEEIVGWVGGIKAGKNEKAEVEVFVDGRSVSKGVADIPRNELKQLGAGVARHGFRIVTPDELLDEKVHVVEVRELTTGSLLRGSPMRVRLGARKPQGISVVADRASAAEAKVETAPIAPVVPVAPVPSLPHRESVITPDRMVGHTAYGWFVPPSSGPADIKIECGGQTLCKFGAAAPRPGIERILALGEGEIGYAIMLGGLLQFSALAAGLKVVRLKQYGVKGFSSDIDLSAFYREAYTFAPLKSFSRPMPFPSPGEIRGARCFEDGRFSLFFEAGDVEINGAKKILLDFYQERTPGELKQVGQFDIDSSGQLINLEFELLSKEQPVLLVATDATGDLLLTDCIPSPATFLERFAPLVEYHSLLGGGQPFFEVAAKVCRSILDFEIAKKTGDTPVMDGQPHPGNTEVLLYARGDLDIFPSFDAKHYRHISDSVSFLGRDGSVLAQDANGGGPRLEDWIKSSSADFIVLCEVGNEIRPDFWPVLSAHPDCFSADISLIYWDSIWLEDAARPYWVRNHMLLHEAFENEMLSPIHAVMVRRTLLQSAARARPEIFRSGKLKLEAAFQFAAPGIVARLPVAMEVQRLPLPPKMQTRLIDEQIPIRTLGQAFLDASPGAAPAWPAATSSAASAVAGVSVVINYREMAEATVQCLQSIRAQRIDAPIEVILVNNGSVPGSVRFVVDAAKKLFGEANVKPVDYDERFNHSAQCNLAVRMASHGFILMLSNDAVLITPDALARAVAVTSVPWVGTCGFRNIGHGDKRKLVSMGLSLTQSKYLFTGSSPVVTNAQMPRFMLDYAVSTVGNTFGAVMIRKSVYEELGGLDEAVFPHNYNDVDFCFRATGAAYQHVVLGSCLVGHIARGSREAELDLPINKKMIGRIPPLSIVTNAFNIVNL